MVIFLEGVLVHAVESSRAECWSKLVQGTQGVITMCFCAFDIYVAVVRQVRPNPRRGVRVHFGL